MIKKILYAVFPFSELRDARKKIQTKIDNITTGSFTEDTLEYMNGYSRLNLETVEEFFSRSKDIKKSLEDKLKISLLSVTLGIAVLTSTIGFLLNSSFSALPLFIRILSLVAAAAAIIFMLIAAYHALMTIGGNIQVYQLFPIDIVETISSEKEHIERLAVVTELNTLTNHIRQNLMNVSFRCIRNSLVLLGILFLELGTSSIFTVQQSGEQKEEICVFCEEDTQNPPSPLAVTCECEKQCIFSHLATLPNFVEGSDVLSSTNMSVIDATLKKLNKPPYPRHYRLRAEGHADNQYLLQKTKSKFEDNHTLSLARALQVKEYIEKKNPQLSPNVRYTVETYGTGRKKHIPYGDKISNPQNKASSDRKVELFMICEY